MAAYFSSTDSAELHDNAPNHAYYLSLIVNYKDIKDWCAKIAICGEQEVTGTTETKTSWKGATKKIELVKKEVVDTKTSLLYTLDCEIVSYKSEVEDDSLLERINSIVDKKAKIAEAKKPVYTPGSYSAGTVYTGNGSYQKLGYNSATKDKFYSQKRIWDEWDDMETSISKNKKVNSRVLPKFAPENIEEYLCQAITQDPYTNLSIGAAMMQVGSIKDPEIEIYEEMVTMMIEEYMTELKATSIIDRHAVAVSMYDLIAPYEHFTGFKILDDIFFSYLLEPGKYAPGYVKLVTGIEPKDQTTVETLDELSKTMD